MYKQTLYKILPDHVKPKILNRIEEEKSMLEDKPKEVKKETTFRGFAEGRSK